MRLKQKELKMYRDKLLKEQGGLCYLCEKPIEPGNETLDHSHETGHCRRVLCRQCNGAEGRILHWAKRSGADDVQQFLLNLSDYWLIDFKDTPIHPTHLTEKQKQIKALKKKRSKVITERAKQRYTDQIKKLQEE